MICSRKTGTNIKRTRLKETNEIGIQSQDWTKDGLLVQAYTNGNIVPRGATLSDCAFDPSLEIAQSQKDTKTTQIRYVYNR